MTKFVIAEDQHLSIQYKAVRGGFTRYFDAEQCRSSDEAVAIVGLTPDGILDVAAVAPGLCTITLVGDADPTFGRTALEGSFDLEVTAALANRIEFEAPEISQKAETDSFAAPEPLAPVEPSPTVDPAPEAAPVAPEVTEAPAVPEAPQA